MIQFKIEIASKKNLYEFMDLVRIVHAEQKQFIFFAKPIITEKGNDCKLYLQFQDKSFSDSYVFINIQNAAEIAVLNYSISTLSSNLEISFKGNYLCFKFSSSNFKYEPRIYEPRIENFNI